MQFTGHTSVIGELEIPIVAITSPETITAEKRCPNDMILVEGDFCPVVEQRCKKWVNVDGTHANAPKPKETGRCGEYEKTKCKSENLVQMKFCIDINEFSEPGSIGAKSWVSAYEAKELLEAREKRLCTDQEWTFACEGPEMLPYPYGYTRDKRKCNFDNSMVGVDVFQSRAPNDKMSLTLNRLLNSNQVPSSCLSPFKVENMVGNIDEWVSTASTGQKYDVALMGGHVFGVRNACRPRTTSHGPEFKWYETGTRGCKNIQ